MNNVKKSDDKLCIIPWIHFTYDGGNISPCCRMFARFNPLPLKKGLAETLNSKEFKKIRETFLKNEAPSSCLKCFEDEKCGALSDRQKFNKIFENELNQLSRDKNNTEIQLEDVKYADLRLSNLCNQSCRTCDSYSSTAWNKDSLELGDIKMAQVRKGQESDITGLINCRRYSFAGGEPLLDPLHFNFLKKLALSKDVHETSLEYNTNLDIDHDRLKELSIFWKKFKSVNIAASIDHINREKMQYIRNGCDYDRIFRNADFVNQQEKISLGIQLTLSLFNVLDLDNIITFFKDRWGLHMKKLEIYTLHDPTIYHISLIKEDRKKEIRERLTHLLNAESDLHLDNDEFIYLSGKMRSILKDLDRKKDTKILENFKERTMFIDKLRKQNFQETFSDIV